MSRLQRVPARGRGRPAPPPERRRRRGRRRTGRADRRARPRDRRRRSAGRVGDGRAAARVLREEPRAVQDAEGDRDRRARSRATPPARCSAASSDAADGGRPSRSAAAIVAAVFALATWRAAKPQDTALRMWSVALAQFAIASGALAWGIAFGWTPLVYRPSTSSAPCSTSRGSRSGRSGSLAPRKVALVVQRAVHRGGRDRVGSRDERRALARGARGARVAAQLPAAARGDAATSRGRSRASSRSGGSVVVLVGLLSGARAPAASGGPGVARARRRDRRRRRARWRGPDAWSSSPWASPSGSP